MAPDLQLGIYQLLTSSSSSIHHAIILPDELSARALHINFDTEWPKSSCANVWANNRVIFHAQGPKIKNTYVLVVIDPDFVYGLQTKVIEF